MKSNIKKLRYESWDHFKAEIIKDIFKDGIFRKGIYLFRGHHCVDWKLASSYDRDKYHADRFQLLIDIFKKECESLNIEKTLIDNEDNFIAFAQHHGVPTRLLDWTYSPYIASFFAFSNLNSQLEVGSFVCVWVLKCKSDIWKNTIQFVTASSIGNERIRNQNGCFTLAKSSHTCIEDIVEKHPPEKDDWSLMQVFIPSVEKAKALTDLDSMGINWSRITPGAEGCAKTAFLEWRGNN